MTHMREWALAQDGLLTALFDDLFDAEMLEPEAGPPQ